MDFFSQQDKARRKTKILVFFFILAILFTVLALNVCLFFIQYISFSNGIEGDEMGPLSFAEWMAFPFWITTLITVGIILLQTLGRFLKLRQGGKNIADLVGARRISRTTNDLQEKRLVNVVEEMSIAAGMPMPTVYVIEEEQGINAFVAGYKPTESVLVVTKGLLNNLNRSELQGVVGHEFSHIFFGDMRINTYLISLLAGLVIIEEIGLFLVHGALKARPRRTNKKGDGGVFIILSIGVMAATIGYAGVFTGRLIRAAISRQREFLADASAVQFTRDPSGIANALYKIKLHQDGSDLAQRHAEEISHMCFGRSYKLSFNLLATHPPLDKRILAINPYFDFSQSPPSIDAAENTTAIPQDAAGFAGATPKKAKTSAKQLTDSVGNPTPEHLKYASNLYATLPEEIVTKLRTPEGAKAIVFALLIPTDEQYTTAARLLLEKKESKKWTKQALAWAAQLQTLGREIRLPLLDLALPSLKQLMYVEQAAFLETVNQLIALDKKVSLFEYVVSTILRQNLDPKNRPQDKVKYKKLDPVLKEISLLLSAVAYTSSSEAQVDAAYTKALQKITPHALPRRLIIECTPQQLDNALTKLAMLTPPLKKQVLDACAESVLADGIIAVSEMEILRAIAERLDCPMPPLVI